MRKGLKSICILCASSLMVCFGFSMMVSAKTETGDLGGGFTYTINDEEKTITIDGKGDFPFDSLSALPEERDDYTLIINDGITSWPSEGLSGKIVFGKDVKTISNPFMHEMNYREGKFEVSPENPYYASYNGCLYTKDYKKLLVYAAGQIPNNYHPNLQIIGKRAFTSYFVSTAYGNSVETIVIPWGVTIIEDEAFYAPRTNLNYVIPDTAIHLGTASREIENTHAYFYPCWIPSRNNRAAWDTWYKGDELEWHGKQMAYIADGWGYETITEIPADNIASYYGLKPNSLKTFQNGKTYYFDKNYKMVKGWNYADGNWYYFNDYGAAVVKCWKQSGGKWFYLQADGTMAKNKWVEWYNKWYYVGADGAMYANRYTPDGYWVNSSGVWGK